MVTGFDPRMDRQHLGHLEIDRLGDLPLNWLAGCYGENKTELGKILTEEITGQCSQEVIIESRRVRCPRTYRVMKVFEQVTACDECRNRALESERLERSKIFWAKICPDNYRNTDKKHRDFPTAQAEQLKDYAGAENLFLWGASRLGKTRLACLMLKRCMLLNLGVTIVWSEKLKGLRNNRDRENFIEALGRQDVVLLDDAITAVAGDVISTGYLKDILEVIQRNGRRFIMTSQVSPEDHEAKAGGDAASKSDIEVIRAIWGRIKENTRVVSFFKIKPAEAESNF